MTASSLPESTRLLDLLIERATRGLDAEAELEMRSLCRHHGSLGPATFEHSVAALQLHLLRKQRGMQPAPGTLKSRLHTLAGDFQAGQQRQPSKVASIFAARQGTGRAGPEADRMGWYAAAAMLLILLWQGVPLEWGKAPQAPAALRAALLSAAGDVRSAAWGITGEPGFESVSGDVVWSDARQEGYMRLAGLPANVPSSAQYQLWIVDPERDNHPVDGGVFDFQAGQAELVIPIHAVLHVNQPAAFAITLEQPGGVVVSDGPLLVVASFQADMAPSRH